MESELKKLSILNWSREDRPREKLLVKGKSSLSEAELISIGSGSTSASAVDLSRMILSKADHKLHKLARMSVNDLMKFKGIGEAKAVSIVSALELGRRRSDEIPGERNVVNSSAAAYRTLKPVLQDLTHESFLDHTA